MREMREVRDRVVPVDHQPVYRDEGINRRANIRQRIPRRDQEQPPDRQRLIRASSRRHASTQRLAPNVDRPKARLIQRANDRLHLGHNRPLTRRPGPATVAGILIEKRAKAALTQRPRGVGVVPRILTIAVKDDERPTRRRIVKIRQHESLRARVARRTPRHHASRLRLQRELRRRERLARRRVNQLAL